MSRLQAWNLRVGIASPTPASVSPGLPPVPRVTLRQVNHATGQHYFQKRNGVWTCDCGAQRDSSGAPL